MIDSSILTYNAAHSEAENTICNLLCAEINTGIVGAENKLWHAHPVWFINGNPIVGYSVLKGGVRLLFWSGQSFDEQDLKVEGTFKAAEVRFTHADEVNTQDLKRWLEKSQNIQWDYKNIVKRRGRLERLK
jgi:hypothetical protein